jgi:hypothetical protein
LVPHGRRSEREFSTFRCADGLVNREDHDQVVPHGSLPSG